MEFMPHHAPFVALAFLGLAATLAASALGLLAAAIWRKTRLIPWIAGLGVVLVAGYATLLLATSAASHERVLGNGEKKYFCEIDCHIAYSVLGTEVTSILGPPLQPVRSNGRWHVVRLQTWFDERTISPHRGDSPLTPNPRHAYIEDAEGRRYLPSEAGSRALAASGRKSTPLTQPLRPGESYETLLAFDLPEGLQSPRLFVGDDDGIAFLLIGHEESPLHRKIWFRI